MARFLCAEGRREVRVVGGWQRGRAHTRTCAHDTGVERGGRRQSAAASTREMGSSAVQSLTETEAASSATDRTADERRAQGASKDGMCECWIVVGC